MTFSDVKVTDTDLTATIVDTDHLFASIISYETPPSNPSPDEGLIGYHLTYQAAEDAILSYISKPPTERPTFLISFRPPTLKHAPSLPRPFDPHQPPTRQQYGYAPQMKVRLSNKAWAYIQKQTRYYRYDGGGPTLGCTHFLLALFAANPLPDNWSDTRPNNLVMYDSARKAHGQFPYWSEAQDIGLTMSSTRRLQRTMNPIHIQQMLPVLSTLADHFLIAPYAGIQTDPTRRALTVLECYGLGFLTPAHHPAICPKPANEDKRRYRANRQRSRGPELVF